MADPSPSRRFADLSIVAPILGMILLAPPVIGLFASAGSVFGAPAIVFYTFGIWFAMIVVAAVLARKLSLQERNDPE